MRTRRLSLFLATVMAVSLLGQAAPVYVQAESDQPQPPTQDTAKRIWADESIYFVMLDRFANGDKSNDQNANPGDPRTWHGGDLHGVIDKLDYIKSMGFTALWITPFEQNDGADYHGYGAVDFFKVDPHFGDLAKLKELVTKAHEKGIKVLFDMVVNHTGPTSPLVSQHPDWFHPDVAITNWSDEKNVQNGWLFNLPDFDQSNPAVRDYILSYSKYWIQQTDVDGFRLDTVRHVPPDFFKWYSAQLQQIKPGFWLIGEVFDNSPFKALPYQQAGVTAMLDFPDDNAARNVFGKDTPMTALAGAVQQVGSTMDDPWSMGTFLDNHDMPRFVTFANQDDPVGRLKLGLEWLFTQRSIPIVYYGTEIAMPGGADPDNRHDFPWENTPNPDVRTLVTKLNQIRHDHLALRRGLETNLVAEGQTYAYARTAGRDQAVVVLNGNGAAPLNAEIPVTAAGLKDGTVLQDALTGARVKVSGGKIAAAVGPRTAAIYVAAPSVWMAWAIWGGGAVVLVLLILLAILLLRRRKR